jgi:hypothetical protein
MWEMKAGPKSKTHLSKNDLEHRVVEVASDLVRSATNLFESLDKPVRTPIDLTNALGLSKDIASRLLSALGKRDSLAVLNSLPGPETLNRVARSARDKVADPRILDAWVAAVRQFETFIANEVGGKHALDAIASAWLPEAREKFDRSSRQTVYRGTANLRGMAAAISLNSCFLFPNADGRTVDGVFVTGFVGLRRLRPGLSINIGVRRRAPELEQLPDSRVGHFAKQQMPLLLEEFCSKPMPTISATPAGDYSVFRVEGEDVGAAAVCDVYLTHSAVGIYPRWAVPAGSLTGPSVRLDVPSERMIFDVIVHQDVWRSRAPELRLYEILMRGATNPNDASFAPYRLETLERAQPIGRGISGRITEIPAYQDILRLVCRTRGFDPEVFRSYRSDSIYPIYGVQYYMVFDAPEKPANG